MNLFTLNLENIKNADFYKDLANGRYQRHYQYPGVAKTN